MTRILAIVNQKGGVGKTTTAFNLGACLGSLKEKVLMIDLDPQANLSLNAGVDVIDLDMSVYDLITEQKKASEVLVKDVLPNVDMIPSHLDLSAAEFELSYKVGREQILKTGCEEIKNGYDYILIDCSPYLGVLTINALTFATEVLITVQTEFFALIGMKKLEETIDIIKKRLNPDLRLSMIVPTMYDQRVRLSGEVLELLKKRYPKLVSKTIIRRNVKIAESPAFGKSIMDFKPNARGAEDYMALAKEIRKKTNSKNAKKAIK
jgi:chromosome partitioning protein